MLLDCFLKQTKAAMSEYVAFDLLVNKKSPSVFYLHSYVIREQGALPLMCLQLL